MCGESSSLWLVPAAVEVNHAFATGARTLLLDALAGESISALRANGIRALLLKGPVTARWLYSDRHPREYVDVDILVASSDFPRTVQMLAELGFREAQVRAALEQLPNEQAVAHASFDGVLRAALARLRTSGAQR